MPTEVHDVRAVLVEILQQIIGPDGPFRNQFQRVAVFCGTDLPIDFTALLVQSKRVGTTRIGGEK